MAGMSDPSKRALFDELHPLMRRNGAGEDLLAKMQEPSWLEQVHIENLRFLLDKHRELEKLRVENDGLYERWQASKGR